MDWSKVNTTLPREPRVLKLARLMGCSRHEALGYMLEWLSWLDGVTQDGETGLTAEQVDELFMCNAKSVTPCNATFVQAMLAVGWAGVNEHGEIYAVNYTEHNGESAKKRAQTAKRVSNMRERERHAKSVTPCNAKSVTREEKNNIDKQKEGNSALNTVCVGTEAQQRRAGKPTPESSEEVRRFMAGQAVCGLKGEELDACASGFFDDMEACGWTARNGAPLYDWQAAARKYLNTWQRKAAGGSKAAEPTVYRSELPKNYDL